MRSAPIAVFLFAALVMSAGCAGSDTGRARSADDEQKPLVSAKELYRQARNAEDDGKFELAKKKYREALELTPGDYRLVQSFSNFMIDGGDAGEAVGVAEGYVEENPGDPRGYHVLGDTLLAARQFRAAIETLDELIGIEDEDANAFEKRGRAHVLAGEFEKGITDLKKAVELEPEEADLIVSLGSALHRAKRLDEAALRLRSAIRVDEDSARAHLILGIVLREQFEAKLALSEHLKAVRLAPEDARAHFELGITQNANNDNLAAEKSLGKSVELDADNATNWYAYGDILRILERWDESIPAYRRALKLDPDHPKAANKLGLVLFYTKDLERAEVVLTDAIRKNDEDPYPYFNLGMVYAQQEKYTLAVRAFERFLELAPQQDGDRRTAKKKIRQLKRKMR